MTTSKNWRNRRNGQYEYSTGFERLCRCGHPLACHIAGGHECIVHEVGTNGLGLGAGGEPCSCTKFKHDKKADSRKAQQA